ncbi:MAG: hypothetical protein GY953_42530 [bacterium]|nr:hypothetical protein [bacterium]
MILTVALFFVATFAMVSAAVVGYRFYAQRHALLDKGARADAASWVEASDLLKTETLSTISIWHRLLERFDYFEIMRQRIAEAGLNWSVGRLTALMLLLGALTFALLARFSWTSTLICVIGAAVIASIPYSYVLHKRRKRLVRFESQFPDTLDSLARALRAGHPLAAGLQMLVYEAPEPMASEMGVTSHERKLGSSWDHALDNLAMRVPLPEVSVFVAAVKLQNRTGGKLSEVLGRLSESMRDTYALKSEVRSIAAHGRMTGRLLTILPVVIAVVMTLVNPSYLGILWKSPMGKDLIAAAIVCLLAAHLVIRKLVDIRL